jgi:hypothetical protein
MSYSFLLDLLCPVVGCLLGYVLGRWSMRREMLRSGVYWPIDTERLRQSVEDERNGIRGRPAQEVFEALRTQERAKGKELPRFTPVEEVP